MKHDIRISHDQCLYIVAALKQCQSQGYFGAGRSAQSEIDLLAGMFDDLPAADDCEHTIHDFTE